MTLSELLLSPVDGELPYNMSKDDLLDIDIHFVEINDDILIVGSFYNPSDNCLEILI